MQPLPAMFGKIEESGALRIGLFGPGGIGKTSLAVRAPGPVAVIDLDKSLPVLGPQLKGLDVYPVKDMTDLKSIRKALQATANWSAIKTIVIDSFTRLEELIVAHTLATVPISPNNFATSVEGYGYGKGFTHVYEAFLKVLGDLDFHVSEGRNVVLVCHDCTEKVPNPTGDDWIRYEPRLQGGKASIRLRTKEWLDHLFFIGYDVNVKKGKATSSGSRAIYPVEQAHCMAKSRTLRDTIVYKEHSTELWDKLFGNSK